ncbi:nucleoside hydrolase [Dendrothele bispora CBS 962.96]|uniref:Nucleoside hydrolase n=1 Tax=Dendrothele bispora (strain CBS 962.96) TaxID=1314807 RepID=A0A4S8MXW9_DENBC|nr:nucleoside hydrolase [Dendrothele bispora CBS 962.96]
MAGATKTIWLDCDPGHDDVTAILLALYLPNIHLLGISTTHGNAGQYYCAINAARSLVAFGADDRIHVYPGVPKPLVLQPQYAPSIHGFDGLGGVEGLPAVDDPEVLARIAKDSEGANIRALEGMHQHIKDTWKNGAGSKISIISTGPMTNVALFVTVYPELLEAIEQFVFMGGGVGLGNMNPAAEFNIMCDPHAAQIVLDANVPAVMIPLNVTHQAIVTRSIHHKLLTANPRSDDSGSSLPPAKTALKHTLSTLISFFADAYKTVFGFDDGPPLHDPLSVAYVSCPEMFKARRFRVDIEMHGRHTIGETVVDLYNFRECDDSWGHKGKNCLVTETLDVDKFFSMLLECVEKCDASSPLNQSR